jgi:putative copper resistance protein D
VGSLSGLSAYGRVSFSLHMVQHMTLSMVAPLLLVLAAPITLALRALPAAPHRQPAGAREWLLSALQSTPARVITHPATALALFVTAPYLIYFSDLFEVALRNHWAHLLMHAHFVVIGYLFYQSLVGVDPVPYRFPHPLRLVCLMLALASHSFFAVALMSSNAVIAGDFLEGLDRPWWPNLLQEQTNGAGFAWAFGEVPGVLVLVALLFRWSRHDERRAHQLDRAADRNSDAELAAYNAMLADRANRRST